MSSPFVPKGVGNGSSNPPINYKITNPAASQHVLTAYLAATGATPQVAGNFVSDNTADSCIYVTSVAAARGAVKITHTKPSGLGDTNASGISIDLRGDGTNPTASQGIFIDSTVGGGTSGLLLNLRNGNPSGNTLFGVDSKGQVIFDNDGLGVSAPSGSQVKLANDGNGELYAVSANRSECLTSRGPLPAAHGLAGWSIDPASCPNSSLPTSGTHYYTRVRVPKGVPLSKVLLVIGTAGTISDGMVAICDANGNVLGSSAAQGSQTPATGTWSIPLTGSIVAPGGDLFVAFAFTTAGTMPGLSRCAGNGACNVNLTGAASRFAADTATGAAIPASPTALGPSSLAWFVGVAS